MLDATDIDIEARRLVRRAIESSPGDSWTAGRLANHLALPVGTASRILAELARTGHVVHVDGEWVSAFFAP